MGLVNNRFGVCLFLNARVNMVGVFFCFGKFSRSQNSNLRTNTHFYQRVMVNMQTQ